MKGLIQRCQRSIDVSLKEGFWELSSTGNVIERKPKSIALR